MPDERAVDELTSGLAFVDLSRWRAVGARGADALAWLDALVSADLSGLSPGAARRSLLLSPTGAVRAEFTVAVGDDEILLLQDPAQATPVQTILAPYVLSADVRLGDRSGELTLLAFPAGAPEIAAPGARTSAPSCVGNGAGIDLLAPAVRHDAIVASLAAAHTQADAGALERWRVRTGIPRLAVDAGDGDLPDEAGLSGAVSPDKGCFLGQEAVAKVRNLGHPRRVLLRLWADRAVRRGDVVESGGSAVGSVTSVGSGDGRHAVFARVRWENRESALRTASGVRLERAG